jgi:hypothetical protein
VKEKTTFKILENRVTMEFSSQLENKKLSG